MNNSASKYQSQSIIGAVTIKHGKQKQQKKRIKKKQKNNTRVYNMTIRRMINMGQRRQRAAVAAAAERDHNDAKDELGSTSSPSIHTKNKVPAWKLREQMKQREDSNSNSNNSTIQTIIEEESEEISSDEDINLTSPKKDSDDPVNNDNNNNNDNDNNNSSNKNNTDLTSRKRSIVDRNKKRIGNSSKSSNSSSSRSSRRSNKSDSNGSSSKTNRSSTNHERKTMTTTNNDNNNNNDSNNNGRKQIEQQRGIHWNPKVEKKRHIMLRDMTDEERDNVWYGGNDTKIILAMAKVTVKMMMKGEVCDDIDYCSRGLEGKTLQGSMKRSKTKSVCRRAVLTEQEIQRMDGVIDPEQLAKSSFKYTKANNDKARDYAIQNEHDITAYLNDVRILLNIHYNNKNNNHLLQSYRTENQQQQ